MSNYTPRAQAILCVLLGVMMLAACSFVDNPLVSMVVLGLCGLVGLVVLSYGYIGPMPAKKGGLSEEEQARDAVAGAMFMDGDDLLG